MSNVASIFQNGVAPPFYLVDGSGNPISSANALPVTANAGTNLNTSALALESGGNLATIATNTGRIPALGAAVAAYGSNPAQTAAAAADTQYKWGAAGNTAVNHVAIQNNTGSNVLYAFDQSTTVSQNAVYVLSAGQIVFWDRTVTILHFSTAAQQSFGGSAGITVEGFA